MLTIVVPSGELFNEETNAFIDTKETVLQLEHSLVSVSKWESKWKKPFLNSDKTVEESIDYIKCMTINHNVPDNVYLTLKNDLMTQIMDYISDPMTATTIVKDLADRYKRAELEWENTLTLRFNRWISTNIFIYPRFDDGATRINNHSYWQLKEYASVGFAYSF